MESPGAVAARLVPCCSPRRSRRRVVAAGARRDRGPARRGRALMLAYVVRRLLYAMPILIGVNLLTFVLFFVVNTPDDMARMQLGVKRVTPEAIERWKAERGYDKPLLFNERRRGSREASPTPSSSRSRCALRVRLRPRRRRPRHRPRDPQTRMGPSLAIAAADLPARPLRYVSFALLLVFFRATYLDFWGVVLCVAMMSISSLFYIIGGQYLVASSGTWCRSRATRRAGCVRASCVLPVLISVVAGIGSSGALVPHDLPRGDRQGLRAHRARQGAVGARVLFRHVLRNALIPILTGVVVVIPLLFMGSLLVESFFGIPGLGSYTIDAINAQDFAVVRAMVFIGSVLYIVGLILTDISYTLVDPRVRLQCACRSPVCCGPMRSSSCCVAAGIGAGVYVRRRQAPAARSWRKRRREPRRHGGADRAARLRRDRPARQRCTTGRAWSGAAERQAERPAATARVLHRGAQSCSTRCCSRCGCTEKTYSAPLARTCTQGDGRAADGTPGARFPAPQARRRPPRRRCRSGVGRAMWPGASCARALGAGGAGVADFSSCSPVLVAARQGHGLGRGGAACWRGETRASPGARRC
jgi:peptide/nickel transport system permease protein